MSALNATVYSSSRVSFAMGRDHNLPSVFSRVHQKKRTPHIAILLSGLLIVFMAVAFPIEDIASATDAMFLLLFIFVNLAVINLRKNRPDLDRGFKVPLFPFIPILATVLNLFLAVFLFFYRPLGVWVCVGYILLGVFIYYLYARQKEFIAKAEPVIHQELPVFQHDPRQTHILVPVANDNTVMHLLRFGINIAKVDNAEITALNIIRVPAQLPPSEGRKYLGQARELLGKAIHLAENQDIPISTLVKVSHNIPKAIIETCTQRNINLMVLGWEGEKSAHNRVFGTILDELIQNTVCDIALVCRAPSEDKEINRVLVPISNLKNAVLSLKIGEAMLSAENKPIVLFHATPHDDMQGIKQEYREKIRKLPGLINTDRFEILIRKSNRPEDAILSEIQSHDLIIMGAPEEGLVRRAIFGDLPERIAREIDVPLILTKKHTGHMKSWFQKFFGARKTILD